MGQLCATSTANQANEQESPLKLSLKNILENNVQSNSNNKLKLHHNEHDEIMEYLYKIYNMKQNDITESFEESIYYLLFIHCKKYIKESKQTMKQNKLTPNDFYLLPTLQRGAFPSINPAKFSAKYKYAIKNKIYCIKNNNKNGLNDTDSFDRLRNELKYLKELKDCEFIVNLYYIFDDEQSIYTVYDHINGGDLKYHLNVEPFSSEQCKFYAAQILIALQYIHSKGIIYRDLKLENVLIHKNGYIKIVDFSTSIKLSDCDVNQNLDINEERIILHWTRNIKQINNFNEFPKVLIALIFDFKGRNEMTIKGYAGTPGYVSPECVVGQYYNETSDLFSFGVLIYRMLSRKTPFRSNRTSGGSNQLDRNCMEMSPQFDIRYFDPISKCMITGLLCKNVKYRLGCNDIKEVFEHPYFDNIDWHEIQKQTLPAPFIPNTEESKNIISIDEKSGGSVSNNIFNADVNNKFNELYYVYDEHLQDHVLEILKEVTES